MIGFLKKIFGCSCTEKKIERTTEIEKVTKEELKSAEKVTEGISPEEFEKEIELKIATMMATISAAKDKPISNFKVKSIKRV